MEEHNQQHSARRLFGFALPVVLVMASSPALSQLKEMGDTELGQVSGKGMLAFDVVEGTDTVQTRFTLGTTIETQVNFDKISLNEYAEPDVAELADLDIDYMSLGHIGPHGSFQVAEKEIAPFVGVDPYFEIAEKNGELTGFRMGFKEAQGTISGNINSFSGNFGLTVVNEDGTPMPTFLMDSNNNATQHRATQVGVIYTPPPPPQPGPITEQTGNEPTPDPVFGADPQMPADLEPPPVPDLPPELITNELKNFKTIELGGGTAQAQQMVNDFFISVQKEEVTWQSLEGNAPVTTGPGLFFNIPSTLSMTLPEFKAGLERAGTEFIDRGNGLF